MQTLKPRVKPLPIFTSTVEYRIKLIKQQLGIYDKPSNNQQRWDSICNHLTLLQS